MYPLFRNAMRSDISFEWLSIKNEQKIVTDVKVFCGFCLFLLPVRALYFYFAGLVGGR